MSEKDIFEEKLKAYLHDPIDKCFDIKTHEQRAKKYAEKLGISNISGYKGSDIIASCMERSLLPPNITQEFTEIRHPFSNGLISINSTDKSDWNSGDLEEQFSKIIGDNNNYDDFKKFLYLWRNLEDKIYEKNKNKNWSKFISIIPADTRIPDHSIWEHLKIASAINAYWDKENKVDIQNNSLFLFTIGPVQSFISQARKTQDFYMGSFILSYLTFKAMEVIIDYYGPTNIIYPDLYKQPLMDWWIKKNLGFQPAGFREEDVLLPTIPNRFVAILSTTDENEIQELADKMKDKIKEEINKSKEIIFKKLKIDSEITQALSKINSQLSEFPEIYWVAVPWKIADREVSFGDLEDFLRAKL